MISPLFPIRKGQKEPSVISLNEFIAQTGFVLNFLPEDAKAGLTLSSLDPLPSCLPSASYTTCIARCRLFRHYLLDSLKLSARPGHTLRCWLVASQLRFLPFPSRGTPDFSDAPGPGIRPLARSQVNRSTLPTLISTVHSLSLSSTLTWTGIGTENLHVHQPLYPQCLAALWSSASLHADLHRTKPYPCFHGLSISWSSWGTYSY